VFDGAGQLVKDAGQVKAGHEIRARVARGEIEARVKKTNAHRNEGSAKDKNTRAERATITRKAHDASQGSSDRNHPQCIRMLGSDRLNSAAEKYGDGN